MMKSLIFAAVASLAMTSRAFAGAFDPGFEGAWIGTIAQIDNTQYQPMALPESAGKPRPFEIAVEIYDGAPRIFYNAASGWQEVKPGKFKIDVHKTNAVIYAIDSSVNNDETAGWVETWNFTLSHKDDDSLYVYWVRAVNNYNLPALSDPFARFFLSGFGEMAKAPPIAGPGRISVSATRPAPRICVRAQVDCSHDAEPLLAPHE